MFTIFCAEVVTEYTKPHYLKVGAEGFDPLELIPNNKKVHWNTQSEIYQRTNVGTRQKVDAM